MQDILSTIGEFSFQDLPDEVVRQAQLCVLDLIGVGIAGAKLPISQIIRDHVARFHGGSDAQMLFDGRPASPMGAALAAATTIDGLDGHDGFNPAKGHIGCAVFPATLAFAQATNTPDGHTFLTNIALGYELGSRLSVALHSTAPDYHTSGAWVALACAAIGARYLRLTSGQTRHALGIAEYHGPRSQMMRVIDHPTMLKDGSGWGAFAGVSAAYLAQSGFTGAPAITVEAPEVAPVWQDLGQRWAIKEQYFKPYPVCRWAQGPIEAVLALRKKHRLASTDVHHIEITTFHESIRLAINAPQNTEQAQYSTSFPCAVAMVYGDVHPIHVMEQTLQQSEVLRLSKTLRMHEDDYANAAFPLQRYAKATLHLQDGGKVSSDWMSPIWTAENPPTAKDLQDKFFSYVAPYIGDNKAKRIEQNISDLANGGSLEPLFDDLCASIN